MNRIFFHPQAFSELNDSALYLERQSSGLGEEFLAAIDISVRLLAQFPDTWPCVRNDIRRIIVPRFLYNIFYRIRPDDTIEIIAIMHPKRKPFNFIGRVE